MLAGTWVRKELLTDDTTITSWFSFTFLLISFSSSSKSWLLVFILSLFSVFFSGFNLTVLEQWILSSYLPTSLGDAFQWREVCVNLQLGENEWEGRRIQKALECERHTIWSNNRHISSTLSSLPYPQARRLFPTLKWCVNQWLELRSGDYRCGEEDEIIKDMCSQLIVWFTNHNFWNSSVEWFGLLFTMFSNPCHSFFLNIFSCSLVIILHCW